MQSGLASDLLWYGARITNTYWSRFLIWKLNYSMIWACKGEMLALWRNKGGSMIVANQTKAARKYFAMKLAYSHCNSLVLICSWQVTKGRAETPVVTSDFRIWLYALSETISSVGSSTVNLRCMSRCLCLEMPSRLIWCIFRNKLRESKSEFIASVLWPHQIKRTVTVAEV